LPLFANAAREPEIPASKLDSFAARTLYPRDLGERLDMLPDFLHRFRRISAFCRPGGV